MEENDNTQRWQDGVLNQLSSIETNIDTDLVKYADESDQSPFGNDDERDEQAKEKR